MRLLFTDLDVLQSKAGSIDHLQRVSAYQTAELMKLQQEVYHLRALLSTHNIDPVPVRPHYMAPACCCCCCPTPLFMYKPDTWCSDWHSAAYQHCAERTTLLLAVLPLYCYCHGLHIDILGKC